VGRMDRGAFEGTLQHLVTCLECGEQWKSESRFTGLPVGMEPAGISGSVAVVA
jgi:hypothetical protein